MTGPAYPPSPGPGPSPGGRPRPKKGSKGCLIALLVVFVGLAMVVVAAGVGLYKFSETEEGEKAIAIVSESWQAQMDARDAPGVAELKAAGCDEALVMDLSRLVGLMEESDAEGGLDSFVVLNCVTSSDDLSCDDVKAAYLSAVPSPPGPYLVQVNHRELLVQTERCEQAYTADGQLLDLADEEAPEIEPAVAPRGPSAPGE